MPKKPYIPKCEDVLLTICGSEREPLIHNLRDVRLESLRSRVEAFEKLTHIRWVINPAERGVPVIELSNLFYGKNLHVRAGRREFLRVLRQPLGAICGYSKLSCRAAPAVIEGPFNAGSEYVYLKIRSAIAKIIGSIHFGEVLDVTECIDFDFINNV
jgi:hypothetical protein